MPNAPSYNGNTSPNAKGGSFGYDGRTGLGIGSLTKGPASGIGSNWSMGDALSSPKSEFDYEEKEEVKKYIRYLADRRLIQLGLKPNFKIKTNPLEWIDWIVNGDSFKNFFEGTVTDYNADGMSGDNWGWELLG